MKVKKAVVTGGCGFIGSHLVERLLEEAADVHVVDNAVPEAAPVLPDAVTLHALDVCDTNALVRACENATHIFHLAALPRVEFSIQHPFEAQHVNVDGTLSVLEAARQCSAGRIVFVSSSAIYGDQAVLPLSETLMPEPKSPYALHKLAGEHLMRLWHELHALETVSLRFFNVYGPRMDPEGPYALVVGKFIQQRVHNKPLTITGDGEQTRDFTHVQDVVDALLRAGTSKNVGSGEVMNIGSGKSTSVNELARLIGGAVTHIPQRIEPRYIEADISRAKELLGWKPNIPLEKGITMLKQEAGLT